MATPVATMARRNARRSINGPSTQVVRPRDFACRALPEALQFPPPDESSNSSDAEGCVPRRARTIGRDPTTSSMSALLHAAYTPGGPHEALSTQSLRPDRARPSITHSVRPDAAPTQRTRTRHDVDLCVELTRSREEHTGSALRSCRPACTPRPGRGPRARPNGAELAGTGVSDRTCDHRSDQRECPGNGRPRRGWSKNPSPPLVAIITTFSLVTGQSACLIGCLPQRPYSNHQHPRVDPACGMRARSRAPLEAVRVLLP